VVAAVIEAMADIKILNASIINPNKFEVFLPVTSRKPLQTIRQEKNILCAAIHDFIKDLQRILTSSGPALPLIFVDDGTPCPDPTCYTAYK
jgi:hypothetical protein